MNFREHTDVLTALLLAAKSIHVDEAIGQLVDAREIGDYEQCGIAYRNLFEVLAKSFSNFEQDQLEADLHPN